MRSVCIVAMAMALAGCTPPVVRSTTSYDVLFRTGVPSEFGYAAPGGEMPVAVVGNPFPVGTPRVQQAVVDAMQGRNYGPRVRFVNGPVESARPGYAVVMLLDAAPGTPADALCVPEWRGSLASQGAGGGHADRLTLLAAFCGGSDARSWAFSSAPRPASPEDPMFGQLVAQTTYLLLPPRDDAFGDSIFE